jgi:hypothetical protein
VDADAHRHRPLVGISGPEGGGIDDGQPAQYRLADGREDDVEAVALGLDLRAVVRRDR